MKFSKLLSCVLVGTLLFATSADSAVMVVDSFSEGGFELKFDGPADQRDVLLGGFLDQRLAAGSGYKDWGAVLSTATGRLLYSVNLRGAPDGGNWFGLAYTSSAGFFSLLGAEGFSLNVTETVGAGELVVSIGETPRDNIRIPIAGPGSYFYPISNIVSGGPLDSALQVQFRFIAKTADFSITLDEITLVPEPSTVALAGIAAAGLLRRRRRA